MRIFLTERRMLCKHELFKVVRGDYRHVDDHKARSKRLVYLSCSGIPVVHCGDKACAWGKLDAVVAGHVNNMAEIKRGMQHGKRFVLRHVYLVEHTKAALRGTLIDRTAAERHLSVFERVRADERCGIGVQIKRDVPLRTSKHCGKVLRKYVLAGCLRSDEQQILTCQQRSKRLAPDLCAVIAILGLRHAVCLRVIHRILAAKILKMRERCLFYSLAAQKIENFIHISISFLTEYISFYGCIIFVKTCSVNLILQFLYTADKI